MKDWAGRAVRCVAYIISQGPLARVIQKAIVVTRTATLVGAKVQMMGRRGPVGGRRERGCGHGSGHGHSHGRDTTGKGKRKPGPNAYERLLKQMRDVQERSAGP